MTTNQRKETLRKAAMVIDWPQVIGNGGPPCFYFDKDDGCFCLRADHWAGHGLMHPYTPLHKLLEEVMQ